MGWGSYLHAGELSDLAGRKLPGPLRRPWPKLEALPERVLRFRRRWPRGRSHQAPHATRLDCGPMPIESDKTSAPETRPAGPELRLLDRRAFVGFPPLVVSPGLTIADFALQIPDVTFPFNVTGGPSRYQ